MPADRTETPDIQAAQAVSVGDWVVTGPDPPVDTSIAIADVSLIKVYLGLSTLSSSISFLQDREEALDHPVPGGGVVAQVSEDTVQPGSVQLSIVDKEQYQQTGQTLVVQEHPSSELDIVRSSQSCSILLMTWATPSYTSP